MFSYHDHLSKLYPVLHHRLSLIYWASLSDKTMWCERDYQEKQRQIYPPLLQQNGNRRSSTCVPLSNYPWKEQGRPIALKVRSECGYCWSPQLAFCVSPVEHWQFVLQNMKRPAARTDLLNSDVALLSNINLETSFSFFLFLTCLPPFYIHCTRISNKEKPESSPKLVT